MLSIRSHNVSTSKSVFSDKFNANWFINDGDRPNSSPWRLIIISWSSKLNFSTTSAILSVPDLCSGEVSIALPLNDVTFSHILASSVATIICLASVADAVSNTCWINGLLLMSNNGFPGSLVEPYLAGIIIEKLVYTI